MDSNPQGIKEGDRVAFLTNLTIHYEVVSIDAAGHCDLRPVGRPFSMVPAVARELVQA